MKYNEFTITQFKNIFYKLYPESDIQILNFYSENKNLVYIKTKFGLCKVFRQSLIKTGNFKQIKI